MMAAARKLGLIAPTKKRQIPEILPIGTKAYFFDAQGKKLTQRGEDSVFECVAINESNARRKFANFLRNSKGILTQ